KKVTGEVRGIFVGRLHPSKGVNVLVEALKIVGSLKLLIDAYGPYDAGDGRLIDKPNTLNLLGVLPDGEVVQKMREYDFVVVPSQVLETGPYTVIEALQAGRPVIGSDLPAINELVHHGTNGLLVRHNDVNAWANAFRRVVEEPQCLPLL